MNSDMRPPLPFFLLSSEQCSGCLVVIAVKLNDYQQWKRLPSLVVKSDQNQCIGKQPLILFPSPSTTSHGCRTDMVCGMRLLKKLVKGSGGFVEESHSHFSVNRRHPTVYRPSSASIASSARARTLSATGTVMVVHEWVWHTTHAAAVMRI